ncbi:MAG TPA: cytochrome P450 [Pseudonocardiaceae bacterium]|nr:cytochrome P450 [Pseudonocardiaceae bacterium]
MTHPGPADVPDLAGPGFDRNPSPGYNWLRRNAPAARVPLGGDTFAWLITRYEDAIPALSDPRLVKSPAQGNAAWRASGMGLPMDHRPSLANHITNTDGEQQLRLRKMVVGSFSPKRMERLRDRAQQITDELLAHVAPNGRAEIVHDLAYPLAITMICDLLGIPEDRRGPIEGWVAVIDSSDQDDTGGDLAAVTDALDEFLADIVAAKRESPGEDLISDLIAQQRTGSISDDEITSMAFLLLVGGHETTVAMIVNATLSLLTHPEHAAAIRSDPASVSGVIEESLRIDSPIRNATWRFPTEPVTIAGQDMEPGDPILVSVLAANRDPNAFPDPDEFLPGRDRRHIAFGSGPHTCIGAAMARMEGRVALTTLFRTFPDLALAADPDELLWWPSPIMRSLFALPVTL